jgi:hypothetical protein
MESKPTIVPALKFPPCVIFSSTFHYLGLVVGGCLLILQT